jgi:hypothetical protein
MGSAATERLAPICMFSRGTFYPLGRRPFQKYAAQYCAEKCFQPKPAPPYPNDAYVASSTSRRASERRPACPSFSPKFGLAPIRNRSQNSQTNLQAKVRNVGWGGGFRLRGSGSPLCLKLCPPNCRYCATQSDTGVTGNSPSKPQVQEITRDSRRELVALTGIEPVFED